MKRLFLAALLLLTGTMAHAQYVVKIAYTYTPVALTAAGGLSAMQTQIGTAISQMNTRYAPAGVSFTAIYAAQAARTSPVDSTPMSYQYKWAQRSVESADQRGDNTSGASISVHLSNPAPGTAGVGSNNPTSPSAWESFMVIPYANLMTDMEAGIGRIFGVDPAKGYASRTRIYPTDPGYVAGVNNGICFHTLESPASDAGAIVPYLAYYQTSTVATTQAGTEQASCTAMRDYLVNLGGTSGTYVTAVPDANHQCIIRNTGGTITNSPLITYTASSGSGVVLCSTELAPNSYSSPGLYISGTSIPVGDSTHNNLGSIAGRASAVFNASLANGSIRGSNVDEQWAVFRPFRWRCILNAVC